MKFEAVYYEPESLNYPLGEMLQKKYADLPWIPIESHNRIEEMCQKPNAEFAKMKRNLIIGIRKTHKYVENHKISDYLVPYTSSGCTAMCLYCYLVCNYNKCAYLRLFVNREQMLNRICTASKKAAEPKTYEIGSNSDLVLENAVTGNLDWTIPYFAQNGRGHLTFPTKFDSVDSLLLLDHQGKTIFRMSVNPAELIQRIELGTSSLEARVKALNRMYEAGYPCGILIAPVILTEDWETLYGNLIDFLADTITPAARKDLTIEVIFMTYSFIHRAINQDAFPNAPDLFDRALMTGRGRGKYYYKGTERDRAEEFLRNRLNEKLGESKLLYIC